MGTQAQTELISLPLFTGLLGLVIGWLVVGMLVRRSPLVALDRVQRQSLTASGLTAGLVAGFALFGILRGYSHWWVLPVGGLLAGVAVSWLLVARQLGAQRSVIRRQERQLYPAGAVLGVVAGLLWLAIIGL